MKEKSINSESRKHTLNTIDNNIWFVETLRFILDILWKTENNKAIFFLGSGFSTNFGIGNWKCFIKKLLKKLISEAEKIQEGKYSLQELSERYFSSSYSELDLKIRNLNNLKRKIELDEQLNLDITLEKIFYILGFKNKNQINRDKENDLENFFYHIVKGAYLCYFKVDFGKEQFKKNLLFLNKIEKSKIRKKIVTTNYDNLFQRYNEKWMDADKKYNGLDNNLFENLANGSEYEFFLPIHGHIYNHYFRDSSHSIWENCGFEKGEKTCDLKQHFLQNHFPIIDSFDTFSRNYSLNQNQNERLDFLISGLSEKCLLYNSSLVFIGYSFDDSFVTDAVLRSLSDLRRSGKTANMFSPLLYIFNYDIGKKLEERIDPLPNSPFIKNISISNIMALKNLTLEDPEIHVEERISSDKNWLSVVDDIFIHNTPWYERTKKEINLKTKLINSEESKLMVKTLESFLVYFEVEKILVSKVKDGLNLVLYNMEKIIKTTNFKENMNYLLVVAFIWQMNSLEESKIRKMKPLINKLLEIFFENPEVLKVWQSDFILWYVSNKNKTPCMQWYISMHTIFSKTIRLLDIKNEKVYLNKFSELDKKIEMAKKWTSF